MHVPVRHESNSGRSPARSTKRHHQIKIVSQQIRSTILWCIPHLVRTPFVWYRISHDTSWYQGIAYLVHCISTTLQIVHTCMHVPVRHESNSGRSPARSTKHHQQIKIVSQEQIRSAGHTMHTTPGTHTAVLYRISHNTTWYQGIAYLVPRYSLPGTLHFYYVVRTCTAVVVCRADSTTILVCTTMK